MAEARPPLSADLEQRSLEDAYRTESVGLMRLAFLMTGSNAVAEDLVHDVFVLAWRSACRLAGGPCARGPAPHLRTPWATEAGHGKRPSAAGL
jgi:DNA-directed RNA polymerase specialized sigma24 family protein